MNVEFWASLWEHAWPSSVVTIRQRGGALKLRPNIDFVPTLVPYDIMGFTSARSYVMRMDAVGSVMHIAHSSD